MGRTFVGAECLIAGERATAVADIAYRNCSALVPAQKSSRFPKTTSLAGISHLGKKKKNYRRDYCITICYNTASTINTGFRVKVVPEGNDCVRFAARKNPPAYLVPLSPIVKIGVPLSPGFRATGNWSANAQRCVGGRSSSCSRTG